MKSFVIASTYALLHGVLAVAPGKAAPDTPAAGCSTSYDGTFAIGIANATTGSAKLMPRSDESNAITLTMTLVDGVLTDSEGRTGYIASNRQFQFDLQNGQAGTIWNSGFTVCPNGTLALQSAIWYGCLSGEFRNLYDKTQGDQCIPLYLLATPVSGSGPIPGSSAVLGGSGGGAEETGLSTTASATKIKSPNTVVHTTKIKSPNTVVPTTKVTRTLSATSHEVVAHSTHIPTMTPILPPKNHSTTIVPHTSHNPTNTQIGGSNGVGSGNGSPSQPPPAGNGASTILGSSFLAIVAALTYAVLI